MAKKTVNNSLLGDVSATRGGRTQVFARQVWDLLGPLHQGWEEVKEVPSELANQDTDNSDAKALDASSVETINQAKETQSNGVDSAKGNKVKSNAVNKLAKAQQAVNEQAANADTSGANNASNIDLNGNDNPAITEDITEASKAVTPEEPVRVDTPATEDTIAKQLAAQEGQNNEQ